MVPLPRAQGNAKINNNMETVTIPKKLARQGDLVVILRKEYEELLDIQEKHSEFYTELNRDLANMVRDYKAGQYYGPFENVEEGKSFLKSRKDKKK